MKREELELAIISVLNGMSMITAVTPDKFEVLMSGYYLHQGKPFKRVRSGFIVESNKIKELFDKCECDDWEKYDAYTNGMQFILNSDTFIPLMDEKIAEFKEKFKDLEGDDE